LKELNEEKLQRVYHTDILAQKYDKYKGKQNLGRLNLQIYMTKHAKERFEERFLTGDYYVWDESQKSNIKIKDLPGWKPLKFVDLDRVLTKAINHIIMRHRLNPGAYIVFSKSTNLVLPIILASIKDDPKTRALVVNTFLHSSMPGVDVFKLGKKAFDHKDIFVESLSQPHLVVIE
jgi:hypothetical protein